MRDRPESPVDDLLPERINGTVLLEEVVGPRVWKARTAIGKQVHVFLPGRTTLEVPEVGDSVIVQFHPYEMSRARICGTAPATDSHS